MGKFNPQAWINAFNKHYPAFLRFLGGLGDVLITTSQTLIVSFGVPIVLILLLVVEHSRVMQGILTFETHRDMASFAAWSLVLLNTILEFVVHYIESKAGYHEQRNRKPSLRIQLEKFLYWIGFGWAESWQPIELSPAHRYRRLLRLITFSVLALALAGSMRSVMDLQEGAWFEALQNILLQSTLSQMTTWLGGLLFALAAISGAQNLTAYLAVKVAEITLQMQVASPEKHEISLPPVIWIEKTRPSELGDYSSIFDRPNAFADAKSLQTESHTISCAKCGWTAEYDNKKSAQMGLNSHSRYCQSKEEMSKNGHK